VRVYARALVPLNLDIHIELVMLKTTNERAASRWFGIAHSALLSLVLGFVVIHQAGRHILKFKISSLPRHAQDDQRASREPMVRNRAQSAAPAVECRIHASLRRERQRPRPCRFFLLLFLPLLPLLLLLLLLLLRLSRLVDGGRDLQVGPLQDIVLVRGFCARINHPLIAPLPPPLGALLQYYCTSIRQYTTTPRHSFCMPHTIQYWEWQYRSRKQKACSCTSSTTGAAYAASGAWRA